MTPAGAGHLLGFVQEALLVLPCDQASDLAASCQNVCAIWIGLPYSTEPSPHFLKCPICGVFSRVSLIWWCIGADTRLLLDQIRQEISHCPKSPMLPLQ